MPVRTHTTEIQSPELLRGEQSKMFQVVQNILSTAVQAEPADATITVNTFM